MHTRIRFVGFQMLNVALTLAGKYCGVAGAWQEAIGRGHVQDKLSELRTRMAVEACDKRLRQLSRTEHAEALAELGLYFRCDDSIRATIDAAVMRSLGDTLLRDPS